MKGYVKVMIAGAVIAAIGLIGFLALLGLNGWNLNPQWETRSYECEQVNDTVKLDYSLGEVNLQFYDGEKILIEYPYSEKIQTVFSENDGIVSITSGKRHWYDVAFWFNFNPPSATIFVPNGLKTDIDAVMNAGELKIADGSYGTVKLYMNAGAAYFGETACDSFECRLNAGTVNVKSVECGTVKTDLNAGYANFEKIVCGDIYFKLNAGSADLKIAGAKAEYNISVDKNAGTCNLDGQTGTTDKKLTCKLNAGSLNASFGD